MDMSDPRVVAVLAHAKACEEANGRGETVPDLPSNLRDLAGTDFTEARLFRANLTNADLSGATLTNANLAAADLNYADLTGAKLEGANLRGADLTGAKIGFADLTDAKVTQDQFNRAQYVDVAVFGYPKKVAEKVILLHEPEPTSWKREAKKRLVAELRSDGKLHIKTPIFKY